MSFSERNADYNQIRNYDFARFGLKDFYKNENVRFTRKADASRNNFQQKKEVNCSRRFPRVYRSSNLTLVISIARIAIFVRQLLSG